MSGRGVQVNLLKLMEETEVNLQSQTDLVGQMQAMMARNERRGLNVGQQRNAIVNGSFEFWLFGKRHEGVNPYQYVANEWLIPSSKRRGALIVSQEQDNDLFRLTRPSR